MEKLRRETARLTQIQDIAGCRVVVADINVQAAVLADLRDRFAEKDTRVVDRRKSPSHGYRAVHAIVRILDRYVEIQLRSALQHSWAELSEALADYAGQEVKYGGGPSDVRDPLLQSSKMILLVENLEARLLPLKRPAEDESLEAEVLNLEAEVLSLRADVQERFQKAIMSVKHQGRFDRDFLD